MYLQDGKVPMVSEGSGPSSRSHHGGASTYSETEQQHPGGGNGAHHQMKRVSN